MLLSGCIIYGGGWDGSLGMSLLGFPLHREIREMQTGQVIAVLKVPITKCPKILNAKWISLEIEELLIWIVQLKRHNQSL